MPKSRQDHASLLKNLIDHFVLGGLEIQYANYGAYARPHAINRHAPDIIAVDKRTNLGYIGEAKMCSELNELRTKEQFEDFSSKAVSTIKSGQVRMPFFIAVPHECSSKIPQTLRDLGLAQMDNIKVVSF